MQALLGILKAVTTNQVAKTVSLLEDCVLMGCPCIVKKLQLIENTILMKVLNQQRFSVLHHLTYNLFNAAVLTQCLEKLMNILQLKVLHLVSVQKKIIVYLKEQLHPWAVTFKI